MRTFILGAALAAIALPALACTDDTKQRVIFESIISGENYVAPPVPEPIPETTFLRTDGSTGYPTDYRGKPAIITLWHPDCPGCKIEADDLNQISSEYENNPDISFVQVAINIPQHFGRIMDQPTLKSYLDGHGHSAIDANLDAEGAIFFENCLVATPTHLVLDSTGKVSEILMGPQPWTSPSARNYIQSLIAGG